MTEPEKERTAFAAMKRALEAAVAGYRAMSVHELASAGLALVHESNVEFPFDTMLDAALAELAAQGSIDAIAMAIAMGVSEKDVAAMLSKLAHRFVIEDMAVQGHTDMMEEFCDGEVAAGRMTKRRCPETGHWLYESVKK